MHRKGKRLARSNGTPVQGRGSEDKRPGLVAQSARASLGARLKDPRIRALRGPHAIARAGAIRRAHALSKQRSKRASNHVAGPARRKPDRVQRFEMKPEREERERWLG